MVIGVYFSEVGTPLLKQLSQFDPHVGKIRDELTVKNTWKVRDVEEASARVTQYDCKLIYGKQDPTAPEFLRNLRSFFASKRTFLLRLLENPNLLEQESFTEQLLSVFHVGDELQYRVDLANLPDGDCRHLAIDTSRAYRAITAE